MLHLPTDSTVWIYLLIDSPLSMELVVAFSIKMGDIRGADVSASKHNIGPLSAQRRAKFDLIFHDAHEILMSRSTPRCCIMLSYIRHTDIASRAPIT